MSVVGPGAITQQDIRPDPTLEGASQYEVVRLHNPLPDDFAIQVAQTRPVDVPYTVRGTEGRPSLSEGEVTTKFGVSLRGPDQHLASKKHILNQAVIPAGQSMNFPGDVAQVAVRQLVNEIMQREGNTKFMADPVMRKEVEDRIILSRGTMDDLMNNNLQTVESQIQSAVDKSNEVQHEEAFPEINGAGTSDAGRTEAEPESSKTESSRGKK